MFHNKEMKRYKTMIWLPATVELEFRLTAYSLDLSFYFVSTLHIRPRPSSEGTELGQKKCPLPLPPVRTDFHFSLFTKSRTSLTFVRAILQA